LDYIYINIYLGIYSTVPSSNAKRLYFLEKQKARSSKHVIGPKADPAAPPPISGSPSLLAAELAIHLGQAKTYLSKHLHTPRDLLRTIS
jgi:hypothetical protein